MQTKMPKGRVIRMILKYSCVYVLLLAVITVIVTTLMYRQVLDVETDLRKSLFQTQVDACQEYLYENHVAVSQAKPYYYFRSVISGGNDTPLSADLPMTVRAYSVLKDGETGEFLADPCSCVYGLLHFADEEAARELSEHPLNSSEAVMVYCPASVFEEAYQKLLENSDEIPGGEMGDRIRSAASWQQFWNGGYGLDAHMEGIYYKADDTFVPGKMVLSMGSEGESKDPKEFVGTKLVEWQVGSAEGQKGSAEGQKGSAEGQKGSAEGQKGSAEGQKGSAEGQKGSAEGQKGSAEGQKGSAEGRESSAEGQDVGTTASDANESVVLDFTPANARDYKYIENVQYKHELSEGEVSGLLIYPFVRGGEAFIEEALEHVESLGSAKGRTSQNERTETKGGLLPREIDFTMCRTVWDMDGKPYDHYSYVSVDNVFWGYMVWFRWVYVAVYGISLILFIVILRHAWLKMKYAYEMECYRKMLVDIMAHDLKTPLTAAGGYVESLKEHLHTDKMDYYAEELGKNIAYMNEIISSNLALSRQEFGSKKPNRKPVDLVEISKRSIEKHRSLAEERKLSFAVNGKAKVRGDEELLSRVFDNLVLNAVKYSVPGSEVTVQGEGHRIRIRNKTDQKLEGNLKRLWEPFVRGDESRSGEKGTGIGLYIAARILDDHKWKYKIHFDPKEGTFECVIQVPWGLI